MSKEYSLTLRWAGYELRPERPPEGERLDRLIPDFDAEAACQQFNRLGAQYDLSFGPVTFLPNTRLALMLTEYAKDQGIFNEFHQAVFKAYFAEGKNIGSKDVLLDIAALLGMNLTETEAALREPKYLHRLEQNRQSGVPWQVTGLPTMIINEQKKIVGAQPYDTFKKALDSLLANGKG
ncbi:DSBA oxidoreductase [Desulforamulus ruminis DSM 2154]|uniref:DSBA oxidoreductase n=1 Tax=Desulforamulus ruminis (strain ATCC 23193 / DSM 2154 / NCIMB 8452 / DL) TaxID=696281 RepID=F6DKM3_DESRL|nr:DSBA oxidoreductase [Desulforamulus ruminis DSM 2154]